MNSIDEILKNEKEERYWKCYREGRDANNANRKVYRSGRGTVVGNPYDVRTDDHKAWSHGYAYQDMVNDG